ncbi:hypothetical protein BJV77DRAFT_961781 [Russula vinacea]|nr:hypothetical protein BJV77DRAFT_961781 [Russula vinacea]
MALSLEPDAHRPIVMFIQKPRIGTPTPLTAPPPRVSPRERVLFHKVVQPPGKVSRHEARGCRRCPGKPDIAGYCIGENRIADTINKRGHLDERATDAHVSLVVQIRLPSFPEVRVIVKHFVGRDARRGRTPFTPSSNNPVHSSVHDNLLRVRGSHCSITGDFGNLSPQSGAHIEGRLREMWCDPRDSDAIYTWFDELSTRADARTPGNRGASVHMDYWSAHKRREKVEIMSANTVTTTLTGRGI